LKIKTDERDCAGDRAAVGEDFLFGIGGRVPRAQAEEAGVIAEVAGGAGFGERLWRASAEAGDEGERARGPG
jgi:hypothetical protein